MSTLKVNDIVDTGGHSLLGRRNLIINGDMQVWQRGTSHSSAGYTADRWYVSSSTYSVAKYESTVVGSYARFTRSVINMYPTTTVEVSNNKFYGKTLTLSFYARTSNDGNIGATITYADDSANTNSIALHTMTSEALTTDWARYTTSFTINDAVGSGTQCIRVSINCTSGTIGHNFDLSQVQLELGSTATPFEHRSYGEELALCQRYYQIVGDTLIPWLSAGTVSTSILTCMTHIPIQMRSQPTITQWGDAGATSYQFANSTNNVVSRMTNIGDYTGSISALQSAAVGNRTIFTYLNMVDSASTRMAPVYTRCDAEL